MSVLQLALLHVTAVISDISELLDADELCFFFGVTAFSQILSMSPDLCFHFSIIPKYYLLNIVE